MQHILRVGVISRDEAGRVDGTGVGALVGACACARSFECPNGATGTPYEAVQHILRVLVISRDAPHRIDARGHSALYWERARARSLERGYVPSAARTKPCHTMFASV